MTGHRVAGLSTKQKLKTGDGRCLSFGAKTLTVEKCDDSNNNRKLNILS